MKMASLKPGVLLKLLEEMGENDPGKESSSETRNNNNNKPVLLQVRSIVPVTVEGDLWPNKGFYLKVSDSSHAMYVSLPHEMDDMILRNDLKLGQFIYVEKIEPSHPVPILRGVTPIPGRHPCVGAPEDVFVGTNLITLTKKFDLDSVLVKSRSGDGGGDVGASGSGQKIRAKRRLVSASTLLIDDQMARMDLDCVEKKCVSEKRVTGSSVADKESDSDSPKSTSSRTAISKRKSWNGLDSRRLREISDSFALKNEIKSGCRSRSGSASPVRSSRCNSSDDSSSVTSRMRARSSVPKSRHISNKARISPPMKPRETATWNGKKFAESKISWDNLPSNLVNLGKEVVRQRDAAVLAAVEALQEAAAAERLIKCLSTFSEFYEEKKEDNQQHQHEQTSVEKFLNLHDDLKHTRLILQSLTNISPLKTSDSDPPVPSSIKDALWLAVERKRNASSWLIAAVASDIPPFPDPEKQLTFTSAADSATKRAKKLRHQQQFINHGSIPRSRNGGSSRSGSSLRIKQVKTSEVPGWLATEKENLPCWTTGSAVPVAANMTESLQQECQKWFLGYLERVLDATVGKAISNEPDGKIAGIMCQIKRVNDWLDALAASNGGMSSEDVNNNEQGNCCAMETDDSVSAACGRVRNKMYGVLLEHVERTAMEQFVVAQQ
ncbi:hypothetical protein Ancab_017624 [Ancistrocladus abbreviatus]